MLRDRPFLLLYGFLLPLAESKLVGILGRFVGFMGKFVGILDCSRAFWIYWCSLDYCHQRVSLIMVDSIVCLFEPREKAVPE